jgi:hypothetical protein
VYCRHWHLVPGVSIGVSIGKGEVQAFVRDQPAEEGVVVVVEPIVHLREERGVFSERAMVKRPGIFAV